MLLFHETQIFTSYLSVVDYLLYLMSTIPLIMYNICICIDTVGHKILSAKLKKDAFYYKITYIYMPI